MESTNIWFSEPEETVTLAEVSFEPLQSKEVISLMTLFV